MFSTAFESQSKDLSQISPNGKYLIIRGGPEGPTGPPDHDSANHFISILFINGPRTNPHFHDHSYPKQSSLEQLYHSIIPTPEPITKFKWNSLSTHVICQAQPLSENLYIYSLNQGLITIPCPAGVESAEWNPQGNILLIFSRFHIRLDFWSLDFCHSFFLQYPTGITSWNNKNQCIVISRTSVDNQMKDRCILLEFYGGNSDFLDPSDPSNSSKQNEIVPVSSTGVNSQSKSSSKFANLKSSMFIRTDCCTDAQWCNLGKFIVVLDSPLFSSRICLYDPFSKKKIFHHSKKQLRLSFDIMALNKFATLIAVLEKTRPIIHCFSGQTLKLTNIIDLDEKLSALDQEKPIIYQYDPKTQGFQCLIPSESGDSNSNSSNSSSPYLSNFTSQLQQMLSQPQTTENQSILFAPDSSYFAVHCQKYRSFVFIIDSFKGTINSILDIHRWKKSGSTIQIDWCPLKKLDLGINHPLNFKKCLLGFSFGSENIGFWSPEPKPSIHLITCPENISVAFDFGDNQGVREAPDITTVTKNNSKTSNFPNETRDDFFGFESRNQSKIVQKKMAEFCVDYFEWSLNGKSILLVDNQRKQSTVLTL